MKMLQVVMFFTAKPNLAQNLKCNHCAAFVSLLLHVIRAGATTTIGYAKKHIRLLAGASAAAHNCQQFFRPTRVHQRK